MNRKSVQEFKESWFQNDLIIFAVIGGKEKLKLSQIEVERANHYLSLLKSCSTLKDSQNLNYAFECDPNEPKLIPSIKMF